MKKDRRREDSHVTKEGETGVSQETPRMASWEQEEAREGCPPSFRGRVALWETGGPWL